MPSMLRLQGACCFMHMQMMQLLHCIPTARGPNLVLLTAGLTGPTTDKHMSDLHLPRFQPSWPYLPHA